MKKFILSMTMLVLVLSLIHISVKIAAEVKDFNAEDFMPKKLTREMDVFMQYGYAAAMEAIADAGEEITVPERMGIVCLLYTSRCV